MIEQWVDVTGMSLKAVAEDMGFASCEIASNERKVPKGLPGAFIPLVGQKSSLQLGVMAKREAHERLARVILQMEPDETLERDAITDAINELSNCLAGRIKREMRKSDATLKIGLPVFIEGSVEDIGKSEFRTILAVMNEVNVSILVVVGK